MSGEERERDRKIEMREKRENSDEERQKYVFKYLRYFNRNACLCVFREKKLQIGFVIRIWLMVNFCIA